MNNRSFEKLTGENTCLGHKNNSEDLKLSHNVFGGIYMDAYATIQHGITDSRLSDAGMTRIYIMDAATIMLFNDILK